MSLLNSPYSIEPMKKILIAGIALLILLIIGALVYVLYYGVPKNIDDLFAQFENTTTDVPRDNGEGEGVIDTSLDDEKVRFRQLTTLPVAGAHFTQNGIRYVERGTGHIYDINLADLSETLISGTTLPRTYEALFSPAGDAVVLINEEAGMEVAHFGTLQASGDEALLDIRDLPAGSRDLHFEEDGNALRFFVPNPEGGTGYRYSIPDDETTALFSIPLRDVVVLWGSSTLLYTSPSAYAEGYLYRIGRDGLQFVTQGGKGLTAFASGSSTLVSTIDSQGRSVRDITFGTSLPFSYLIPEKCAALTTNPHRVVCASPLSYDDAAPFPDSWYQGTMSTEDALLLIDSKESTITILSTLGDEVGRPIDVGALGARADGNAFYFINRYDGALWLFTP